MTPTAIDQAGRSHIQRDLKHLVRDVRHDVKAELKDLRASGGEAGAQKATDVRDAYFSFRDQVQDAFRDAGQGGSFDAAAVPEGLRLALVDFTSRLAALNGTGGGNDSGPPVIEEGPQPAEALPPGSLFDLTA